MKPLVFALSILIGFTMTDIVLAEDTKDETIIAIQEHTSAKGLNFMLVEDHTLPIVAMDFAFAGSGSINDPIGKSGLGQLTSNILDEGAGDRNAHDFQKALQDRAIELSFFNGRDNFGGRIKTLKRHLPVASELLSDALNAPLFEEDAITRMKNANIMRIKSSLTNPDWQAARLMNATYFDGHPYAGNSGGTISGLTNITADDMRNFVTDYLTKDRLTISVAGDLTPQEASELVDEIFMNLPQTSQASSDYSDFTPPSDNRKTGVRVDSPQSVVMMVWPLFPKTDPDYYALRVLNHILGAGGFSSYLMDRVREQQGLTYGIYSRLISMDYANYLSIESSTTPDNVEKMIEAVEEVLNELKTDQVTQNTLQDAKNYLIGSLPLRFSSTQSLSSTPLSIKLDGLPLTYLDEWSDNIASVTADDVRRVAQRVFADVEPDLTVLAGGLPNDETITVIDTLPGVQ